MGLPVVVQVRVVALVGRVIVVGEAERETEIGVGVQMVPFQVVPPVQTEVTVV